MFIALIATSFGHNGHHQAILQKLKRLDPIVQIVNLYGIRTLELDTF